MTKGAACLATPLSGAALLWDAAVTGVGFGCVGDDAPRLDASRKGLTHSVPMPEPAGRARAAGQEPHQPAQAPRISAP